MRLGAGARLPEFTKEQSKRVIGSWDIFFLNHYTTQYYFNATVNSTDGWFGDQGAASTPYNTQGDLIGQQAQSPWLYVVPWGIYKVSYSRRVVYRDMFPSISHVMKCVM
jgi:beta-glucosidase